MAAEDECVVVPRHDEYHIQLALATVEGDGHSGGDAREPGPIVDDTDESATQWVAGIVPSELSSGKAGAIYDGCGREMREMQTLYLPPSHECAR